MCAATVRLLIIGRPSISAGVTLARLSDCGWGWYGVESILDAQTLLKTFQIDVVLAKETLGDGRGYDIAEAVTKQKGTLLVGVALSENSLWLPVIDRGERVLGSRAIASSLLEAELVRILTARAIERGGEPVTPPTPERKRAGAPRAGNARPGPQHANSAGDRGGHSRSVSSPASSSRNKSATAA